MWKLVEGFPKNGHKVFLECSGVPEDPHPPVTKWVNLINWRKGKSRSCGCLVRREAREKSEAQGLSAIPSGTRFGLLVVDKVYRLSDVKPGYRGSVKMAHVTCNGSESNPHEPRVRQVYVTNLTQGLSKSCGCVEAGIKHGLARKNGKRHPLYHIWNCVKSRTENVKHNSYSNYGGRGIHLSEEFQDVTVFTTYIQTLENFENREAHSLQLDREDNERGYERGNLRWVSCAENAQNTRRSLEVIDTSTGAKLLASKVAKDLGKSWPYTKLRKDGNNPAEALNKLTDQPTRFSYIKKVTDHV